MDGLFQKEGSKAIRRVAEAIREAVQALKREIEVLGPVRPNWKNFGKLKGSQNLYHCHVKSGRPTYFVCWEVVDKKICIVEVYYVGTHEKAPY